MNDLISVIIPIYNTEKYLSECIESITNQTYKNLEILLINDGSKDKSIVICNKYKNKDKRIKVIDKENSGVSDTRNLGIKKSTGKYIIFIDSDDFIEKDMMKKMYEEAIEKKADVVRCLANIYDKENNIKKEKMPKFENRLLTKKDLKTEIYEFCTPSGINCYSPLLLIKKEKIVLFDTNLTMMEDTEFYIRLLLKIDSIYFMKEYLYNYRYNESSSSKNINNCKKNIYGIIDSGNKIKQVLLKKQLLTLEIEKLINNKLFGIITPKLTIYTQTDFKTFYKNAKEIFKSDSFNNMINNINFKKLSTTKKIYAFLIKNKMYLLFAIVFKIKTKM